MTQRVIATLLVVLNLIVLLGQVWPEGAPPFARTVNIAFLAGNLVFLLNALMAGRRNLPPGQRDR